MRAPTWSASVARVQDCMSKNVASISAAGLTAALIVLMAAGTSTAASATSSSIAADDAHGVELAHADGSDVQPCREYSRIRAESSYSDEYVFGLTRGIADSTMHPAAKILVFPMTVPLDLALLPFEVIGGLF